MMRNDLSERELTPFDIIWIKNITNSEYGSAYMNVDSEFVLHFPNRHCGNILKPQKGEIILLYQNINGHKVFTHLVTPVKDKIEEEGDRANFRYGRKVRVIAHTPIDDLIFVSDSLWSRVNFQGISQGNACEISHISKLGIFDDLLRDIWVRFTPFFKKDFSDSIRLVENISKEIDLNDPDFGVTEGKERLITHIARERNKEIVYKKKQQALKQGLLKCSVCEFSFIDSFGAEFIECHHVKPISESGETTTKLEDLELVCSNCHRMLHRKFEGHFLSICELKNRIIKYKLLQNKCKNEDR
ncbi:HNH endonuclease [Parabacteroides sp. AF48-14]|uniref:HNH endonuclease n=1 Tax=Parabacteroides sp. AF48-14 TaxID=2292052 RepID=UPI001314AB60|nr:HNH endonuclease [Parabacteroides sp. AF48-14]